MRKRLVGIALSALLIALWVGLPMLQAQSRGLGDPDLKWEKPPILVGFPGEWDGDDEGGDDEGDDEGVDCPPDPAPVPKTGQTTCWRQGGAPRDCAGTGQDGELQLGVSEIPRFTNNGDGTVKDNLTGLVWSRHAVCGYEATWIDALERVDGLAAGSCGLADGSIAGDWRLPNVRELLSVLDYGHDPALPPGNPFFVASRRFNTWTSTTSVRIPNQAWVASLDAGFAITQFKGSTGYLWPVRGPE